MSKMNPEIKAKWVAALRSGEYKQGKGSLSTGGEFCCLGVLCDLYDPEGWDKKFHRNNGLPPDAVDAWSGLVYDARVVIGGETRTLYEHNDEGRTFSEIAQAIEEQL